MQVDLGAPGQAAGVAQPGIGGAAAILDAGMAGDAALGIGVAGLGVGARVELQLQEFLAAPAEQRQQAVRGDLRQRLGVVEVVAELLAGRFLAFHDLGADHAVGLQPLAQFAQQRRILAPALDQDRARALQRGLGVGHALVGVDERRGERFGHLRGIGEQAIGQWLQPGLARDLRAGAALLLVRQVQVLQPRLAVGGLDLGAQFVGQLALLVDARQDRGAALLHLAQVGQAHFEVAQLGVVEAAGDFLAVARDERHGRALVEQADGGDHLRGLRADLPGDGLGDLARERGGEFGHGLRILWRKAESDCGNRHRLM